MIRFVDCRMLLLIITILLLLAYSVLILYFWLSWRRIPEYRVSDTNRDSEITISVIVPARNEERNIAALLKSLQRQIYPQHLTEILVIDDHSTDQTAAIVKSFGNIKLLRLDEDAINSYKKRAIETAIHTATGDLIVTTDADCIAGPRWLQTIAGCKKTYDPVFIAAPVAFAENSGGNRLLYSFQVLDFLVLQGITAASVYTKSLSMCNGANLAYEKKAFHAVDGFTGIDHIASGDDMLLMHKISRLYPDRIQYIKSKEAIVYTQAASSWKEFIRQRIRWASKANTYEDKRIFWVLLFVYLFNLSFLGLSIAGFADYHYWFYLLFLWLAKTVIEFPFVYSVARFFGRQSLLKYFIFFQPLHILYTLVAGWLGQFGSYEWKGRTVR